MKGVIVENKGKKSIFLRSDGTFGQINNIEGHNIGDEINLSSSKSTRISFLKTAIAAIFAIMIGTSGFTYYTYAMPASEVSVDINPSINLVLNKADKVIRVEALNDDAIELLEKINIKGLIVEDATQAILDAAEDMGYITDGAENEVIISVSALKDANRERLMNRIEEKLGEGAQVENATLERVNRAKEMGITPGKLVIIEKLQALDPTFEADTNKDMSVKEIQARIKELRSNSDNKENNGNGNAYGKDKDKPDNETEDEDIDEDEDIAPSESKGKPAKTTKSNSTAAENSNENSNSSVNNGNNGNNGGKK